MSDTGQIRRIEAELHESRDQLRLALTAARMGIWDWDVATQTLTWSPGLEEIHGMLPGTFDGTFQGFIEVVHPDDRDTLETDIGEGLRTGSPFATEFRAIGHDDAVHWVAGEGRVITDDQGRPVRMIGVGRDISARRHAEQALRESEQRFRTMADSAPVLIWLSDTSGGGTYFNAQWLEFTGRTVEQELGDGWTEGVHPDDRARSMTIHRDAFSRREAFEIEYRLRRADGEYRWLLGNGMPRWAADGSFEGLTGSCIDITERRRVEEADRLLAEIGLVLDRPLSLEVRLEELARTLLPRVADGCIVDLLDDAGVPRRVAVAHVDSELRDLLGSLPGAREDNPIGTVGRTGAPVLVPDVTDEWNKRVSLGTDEAVTRKRIGTHSAVVVPLVARGRRIGVLSLTTTRGHSNRRMDETDLRLAERIAGRAALAIDNARVFEAEHRALLRTAFLSEATEVLGSSLEYEQALQTLARLVVRDLADGCVIHLVNDLGVFDRIASAHDDRVRLPGIALSDRYALDAAVVRGSRAGLSPEVTEADILDAAGDREHVALLREGGPTSRLSVPLTARGTIIGALTMVTVGEFGRRLGDGDLALARELAERAASAIDNARLFRAQRTIADTLQQALLPATLPEIPGALLGAAYVAMGAGIEAGGDFYDVFPCEDHWVLVAGDVCGKGPEAASLTALARYTLRALAPLEPHPGRLLAALNGAVVGQRPDSSQFLTACVGMVTAREDGLAVTLASAGHPPPLILRAAGGVEAASARGSLLGIFPEVEIAATDLLLAPGDRLVLYTDGLTETRTASGFLEESGLADMVASLAWVPTPDFADALARAVRSEAEGAVRDDIAILVIEAAPA